ncbi:MAG TPA: hypothetical protein VI451_16645, partial [Anaerolineales bacterium]|nr:hypothetical protein [Anaerolineales bacterium]
TSQVLAIRARQHAPSLPNEEAELLIKINERLPFQSQKRYDELIAKRRNETLIPQEYEELLQLTKQSERLQARRVEYLSTLAQFRQTTLAKLLEQLGVKTVS